MIGTRFGFLTIIEEPFKENKMWHVKCRCECGTERVFKLPYLKCGDTKSCGCYNKKRTAERNKENRKYTEEMTKHPLYEKWMRLKKKFKDELCEEWQDYLKFYEWGLSKGDHSVKLYLYRHDELKQYSPDNCYLGKCESNYNVEKYRETCRAKYNVDNIAKLESIKDKIKEKQPEIRAKIEATNMTRYGVKHPAQCPTIREKQVNTLITKYGKIAPCSKPKTQYKIIDWLNSISDNSFISHKYFGKTEIDIFSEKFNLGIEYCGLYWHCEDSVEPRTRLYHKRKLDLAYSNKFRLITIFSDEWIKRKKQVKSFLKSAIGVNQKIAGNKCYTKLIVNEEGRQFIELNHIQGGKNSTVYFGLFTKLADELVGVMSLGKHHRNQQLIVLDRLCFKDGVSIYGGSSKLFSKAKEWCRLNNYHKIISWSDNRWTEGKVYEKLGFKLEHILQPDYTYVNIKNGSNKRLSKQSCKKDRINCPEGKTEKEHMIDLGYSRIWDCGKKRWAYDIT